MKKPMRPNRGRLSAQKVAVGMNAADRNAKRLFKDAKLLFVAKRFPTACSLAILSIEEAGKATILREIATALDERELEKAWKKYNDHRAKNIMWILADFFANKMKGVPPLADVLPIIGKGKESNPSATFDAVKQMGFYTDYDDNGNWSEPSTVLNEKAARAVLFIAQLITSAQEETTEKEIELWVKHVGSCRGTLEMSQGVIEFYREMSKEGLTDCRIEDIEVFIKTILAIASGSHDKEGGSGDVS